MFVKIKIWLQLGESWRSSVFRYLKTLQVREMLYFSFLTCLIAQLVKNPPAVRETWVWSLGWEDPLDEGKGHPPQYSGLENSMDCIVGEVAKSRTQLSDFHFQREEPGPVFTENGLWLNSRKHLELSNSWIVNCLVRNEPPVTKSGKKEAEKSAF